MNAEKLIWDIPVRMFHWLLVATVSYSWFSVEVLENLEHHFISGYIALTLLLFRLGWGLFGTNYARFSSFLFGPSETLGYARSLFSGQSVNYPGHNPLGGLSVVVLLLLLAVQAVTGLFADDEYYFFGPLNSLVSRETASVMTNIHKLNINLLLGFITLHILAVVFYLLVKKENLVKAMFTGRKPSRLTAAQAGIEGSSLGKAVLWLLVCIAIVVVIVNLQEPAVSEYGGY